MAGKQQQPNFPSEPTTSGTGHYNLYSSEPSRI